jgi:hexulose-6-phosphate isomerase
MRIGIMQGRLSPPADGRLQAFPGRAWRAEFSRAAEAGLAAIEWIYECPGAETNPLATDRGVREMSNLARETGVAVRSMCADYFMERPLIGPPGSDREHARAQLEWLVGRCAGAGIERIVLPFVDASSLRGAGQLDALVVLIEQMLPMLRARRVELHLELDLPPRQIGALLARIPDPAVWINYDSGNSASLGFAPDEEFAAYGRRIGSIHIKDRVRGGGSVPLGAGDADLRRVCALIREVAYDGDLILQTARGTSGDEVAWASANRTLVEGWLRCD